MKKVFCILLIMLCFVFLTGFSGISLFSDKVNRTQEALFPRGILRIENAYVHLEKGYAYHFYQSCDAEELLLNLGWREMTEMSEYEAIYRGFFKCPDCARVRDISQTDIETIIQNTVEEAIVDTLLDLFSE